MNLILKLDLPPILPTHPQPQATPPHHYQITELHRHPITLTTLLPHPATTQYPIVLLILLPPLTQSINLPILSNHQIESDCLLYYPTELPPPSS